MRVKAHRRAGAYKWWVRRVSMHVSMMGKAHINDG